MNAGPNITNASLPPPWGNIPPSQEEIHWPRDSRLLFGHEANNLNNQNFSMNLPNQAPIWPASVDPKRQPTATEWEVLKPMIRQLWYENDLSYKEVAKVLLQTYNFEPTCVILTMFVLL